MNETNSNTDAALNGSMENFSDIISSHPTQLALALLALAHAVRPQDSNGRAEFDRRLREFETRIQNNQAPQDRENLLLRTLLDEMTR